MLTLHTYFRSSASYRVRIALELKSLTYESIPVHLVRGGGDQHSAAFAALNPAELVPVLSHDGLTITQSLAIIEYLEEIRPTPSLLPGDAASRARIRSIAQLIACEVHPLNNLRGTSAARVQCWHGQGRPRSLVCTLGDQGIRCTRSDARKQRRRWRRPLLSWRFTHDGRLLPRPTGLQRSAILGVA
jgi:maleylacetoacetate isomerase